MTPAERKAAFRHQADLDGQTLHRAAFESCGVTWFHLSSGIADTEKRPMSADVKQKFATYIGRSVEFVFGVQVKRGRRRRKAA